MTDQEFDEMLQSLRTTEIDVTQIEREAREMRARAVAEGLANARAWLVRRFSGQRGTRVGQTA